MMLILLLINILLFIGVLSAHAKIDELKTEVRWQDTDIRHIWDVVFKNKESQK